MDKKERARLWQFIAYPESLPEDWKDRLEKLGCKVAVSPLHDKDLLEDRSGGYKKPHYHVILSYSGNKSYDQVKRITDDLGQPIPLPVQDLRGAVRYLSHMDSPKKAQYEVAEIQTFGGFDISTYIKDSFDTHEVSALRELLLLVHKYRIVELAELVDIILLSSDEDFDGYTPDDILKELKSSAYLITNYITSYRYKKQPRAEPVPKGEPELYHVSKQTVEIEPSSIS